MDLHSPETHKRIADLRRKLAEAHDLRLISWVNEAGQRVGTMVGTGPAASAAADAYNFLADIHRQDAA